MNTVELLQFSLDNAFSILGQVVEDVTQEQSDWHPPGVANPIGGTYWHLLTSVDQVQRILEVALLDTLGLDNSVARSRTLAYLAVVALKGLEAGQTEDRLTAREDAMRPRLRVLKGKR